MLRYPEEQTFYDCTLIKGLAWCLVWFMGPKWGRTVPRPLLMPVQVLAASCSSSSTNGTDVIVRKHTGDSHRPIPSVCAMLSSITCYLWCP